MAARKSRGGGFGAAKAGPRPEGQVRRSQVLTTFGPGALVDFPKHAAIMGGLESWGDPDREGFTQIFEPRLEAALRAREQNPSLRLFAPPSSPLSPDDPQRGIAAFEFPEWFVEQPTEAWVGEGGFRPRRLVHRRAIGQDRHGTLVPIRFVQACPNGHISDLDWRGYVHGGHSECTKRELFLDERGTSGDLADIIVRCACKMSRSLVDATQKGDKSPLGPCWGEMPWLGGAEPGSGEAAACVDEQGKPRRNKLLVRSATNAYFPQNVSAISIPADAGKQAIREAAEQAWGDLEAAEGADDIAHELKKAKYKHLRDRFTSQELWAEVQRKKSGAVEERRGIKAAELDRFLATAESAGEDTPEKEDFFANALSLDPGRIGAMSRVSRIVLVHRLREVNVQLGFTRFEAPARDVDYELSLGVRTAPLAREVRWLPAVENRGEGIFLALDPARIAEWLTKPAVMTRERQIEAGFEAWKMRRQVKSARFPGVTYVMLHSLSHLLLTAVSLECGYAASSIRERVYLDGDRCGILLFTGTPDAEGTLGGLVQVGKKLGHHLEAALALGRLCSNDPVCAQHHPDDAHEERFLHGAACHGCLLVSEPSCEWSNELLDRSLVVDTVEGSGAAFFPEA